MKEKILSFLKTNAKLAGVPDNYLLGVADHYAKSITEESQIATTLTDGVVDLLKFNADILQVEGDRRATAALKTFKEKNAIELKEEKPKEKPKEVNSDEPAWFTKFKEDQQKVIDGLSNKLSQQEKEKSVTAMAEKVKSHDKLKNIPKSFLAGRNLIPESEDKIDELVTTIEGAYNNFTQEMAEKGVVISIPPTGGASLKDGATAGKSIAEKRNANTSDGVKGKAV